MSAYLINDQDLNPKLISREDYGTNHPSSYRLVSDECHESVSVLTKKITLFKLFMQDGPYFVDDNLMEFMVECLKKAKLDQK